MLKQLLLGLVLPCCVCGVGQTQEPETDDPPPTCQRIMVQDPALNNLVDPPSYQTAELGTLGGVLRTGEGSQAMILIPGLGFGGDVFTEFMKPMAKQYRMYAVTLPGFAGTAAPPCPSEETSFGDQTWTNGALSAIENLIDDEKLDDVVLVGHWLTGTQLALRLAIKYPEKVKAVIILAGSARMTTNDPARAVYLETLEKRVAAIDDFMAPQWFKTVTRETWDDNNFLPADYAVHPVQGLRLWRQAARPLLHVWVRYLCEFNAQDVGVELSNLTVPTLILKPGLEGLPHDAGNNYMEIFLHDGWKGYIENHPQITAVTIANARACPWFDQPAEVQNAVTSFLQSTSQPASK
jgi:pimeloyl-ACP methyl ester carboxylesterase